MPESDPPKPYGIVYKATNKVNGKVYIGITTRSLDKRILGHKKKSKKPKTRFHSALKKYGVESFLWEVLCFAYDTISLQNLEVFYIKKFDSTLPDLGYNMTPGGDKVLFTEDVRKKISKANKGRKREDWEKENIRAGIQERILKNGRIVMSEESREKLRNRKRVVSLEERKKQSRSKRGIKGQRSFYIQKDLSGNILNIYKTLRDASIATGYSPSCILSASCGKIGSCGGFLWERDVELFKNFKKEEEENSKKEKEERLDRLSRSRKENLRGNTYAIRKEVIMLDLSGNIVNTYPSVAEAARDNNLNAGSIAGVCRKGHGFCGGYEWKFSNSFNAKTEKLVEVSREAKKEDISLYSKKEMSARLNGKTCSKPLLKFDLTGNLVCKYPSVSEAAYVHSVIPSDISRVCRGGRIYGGYLWVYQEVFEKTTIEELLRSNFVENRKRKAVLQFDFSGKFIQEYPSIRAAAKSVDIDPQNISATCHGRHETCCGYVWKFKDKPK